MELGQVRGIDRLVAEDAIDGEVLLRLERLLLRQRVEHARRDGGGVRAQQVLLGLGQRPVVAPTGQVNPKKEMILLPSPNSHAIQSISRMGELPPDDVQPSPSFIPDGAVTAVLVHVLDALDIVLGQTQCLLGS